MVSATKKIKPEVVTSTIVEAGVLSGDIEQIIVESEVVVEAEVEAVDKVEDIPAILVERQVTTAETAPRKTKNANIVEPLVMWNSPVSTRKTKLHECKEKGCVLGEKQLSLVKSMRRRVVVMEKLSSLRSVKETLQMMLMQKKVSFSTMVPVTIPVGRKIFSKSSKIFHTRSSCIIWSEVCV